MKGKKILAGLISAVMVLGTMVVPAFADNVTVTEVATSADFTDAVNNEAAYIKFTAGEEAENKVVVNAESGYKVNQIFKKDCVIDLNGKTLVKGDVDYIGLGVNTNTADKAVNVTFKNGNIEFDALGGVMFYVQNGTLTFDNVTFNKTGSSDAYALIQVEAAVDSVLNLKNCTMNCGNAGKVIDANTGVADKLINIEDTTINTTGTALFNGTYVISGTSAINGSVHYVTQNVYTVGENVTFQNYTGATPLAATVTDRNGSVTYYATFAEAYQAAGESDTLTMYEDAVLNTYYETINTTIELNGNKLTFDSGSMGYQCIAGDFELKGDDDRKSTLELKSSVPAGSCGEVLFGIGYSTTGNNNVKMSGLTITTPATYDANCGVIGTQGNSTLEMNNVTIKAGKNICDFEERCSAVFWGMPPVQNETENKITLNDVDIEAIDDETPLETDTVFHGCANIDFNDVTFTGKVNEFVFSCVSGTVKNSEFTYTNTANESTRSVMRDAGYKLALSLEDTEFNDVPTCTDGVFNIKNKQTAVSADEETEFDTTQAVWAAKIDDTCYGSLETALAKAQTGDTITLLANAKDVKTAEFKPGDRELTFDLNGHKIFFDTTGSASVLIYKNLKFTSTADKKGTIDFTNASVVQSVFWIMNENTTVTLNNVNLVGSPTKDSGAGFFQSSYLEGAKVVFNNSEVTLTGVVTSEAGAEPKVYNRESYFINGVDAELNDTKVSVTGFDGVFVNAKVDINGTSEVHVYEGNHTANRTALNMSDEAVLTADHCYETAIKLGNNSSINLKDTSRVRITNSQAGDIKFRGEVSEDDKYLVTIKVAPTAKLEAILDEEVAQKAAVVVSVAFERIGNTNEYNIALVVPADAKLHEFTSAQLKFKADNDEIGYEIAKANDKIVVSDEGNGVYLFNLKSGETPVADASEIIIGKVTFEGYSERSVRFGVDGTYENKVVATKGQNLPDVFTVEDGRLSIDEIIEDAFKEPECEVTINVMMNLPVTDNNAAYQDMTLVIAGESLDNAIEYKLGNDGTDGIIAQANNNYRIAAVLKQNKRYVITVTGAGYRKATHILNTNERDAVTVNFWNNVQKASSEIATEAGIDATKKNASFIAGDIIKDNRLNIYDLSAVVAYFGEKNDRSGAWDKVKYDLNRDGVINAEDVSIVLNAWKALEELGQN